MLYDSIYRITWQAIEEKPDCYEKGNNILKKIKLKSDVISYYLSDAHHVVLPLTIILHEGEEFLQNISTPTMDYSTALAISVLVIVSVLVGVFLIIRCLMQGKKCPSRHRLDGKVAKF